MGLKPIGSSGILRGNKIYNEDALLLQKHASLYLNYDLINPFSFLPPVSPNIAALLSNTKLTVKTTLQRLEYTLAQQEYDIALIEGVGGWECPLNNTETMGDLAYKLNIPIILVVGIKLGCLNHAILTYHAIKNKNLLLKGWVANCLYEHTDEIQLNLQTLQEHINAPCLGIINLHEKPEEVLDITFLV